MATADAVVVGAGPNGLAAAITLARAGLSVVVLEAEATIGGGVRSAELTLPGFTHDICSSIHPFGYASPFFRSLPLEQFGLRWIQPPAPVGHALEDGRALVLENSLAASCAALGEDGKAYASLLGPARAAWNALLAARTPLAAVPKILAAEKPVRKALGSACKVASRSFARAETRALFAGMAGHSMLPLEKAGTAGVALGLLVTAHAGGWPFPQGGAQKLSDALAGYLRTLGGEIRTGCRVTDLRELASHRAVLLDLTPRQIVAMAGTLFPERYLRALRRYRYGIAAYKMDWALSDPVPWRSAELRRAATLHLGGTLEEIAAAERAAWNGSVSERPFVLAAQHSLFDATRAPAGKHTLWAYCHVPSGSELDMSERMERQIERFAPGFRDCILARSAMPPRELEKHNANLVGGDISGGVQDLWQSVIRPTWRHWKTPRANIYICSSSTPPGVGVHGMCGYAAGRLALKNIFARD